MKFLNIGPLELIAILVLALIIMGPKDMVKAGSDIGHFIRKVVKSPIWRTIVTSSREIKELPSKIVNEAGIDEEIKEFKKVSSEIQGETRVEADIPVIDPVSVPLSGNETKEVKETRF